MFDPVCKFLVENHSADFAQWLLGQPVFLSAIEPSELSLEPIRADALILLESNQPPAENTILHIEFQTYPDPKIPFRMLDYWVRTHRRNPEKTIRQVVIYLSPSSSYLVHQTRFQKGNTSHTFEVIRLWEQPFESFLTSPGMIPFAILSQVSDPVDALREIAIQIRQTVEPELQQSIGASTAILAGLVSLDESLIQRIIGMDLLEQSTVYQSIKRAAREEGLKEGLKEGIQEGLQQGRQQGLQQGRQQGLQQGAQVGKQEGQTALLLRLLNRKIGELNEEIGTKVKELSIPEAERLGDALFDFSNQRDLEQWFIDNEKSQKPKDSAEAKDRTELSSDKDD